MSKKSTKAINAKKAMKQEVKKDAKAAAVETKAVQPVKEAEKALKPTETKITVKAAAKKEAVKEATKDIKALQTAAKDEVLMAGAAILVVSMGAFQEGAGDQEAYV